MRAKAIMVQGTASSVGKSVLAAALCRIFRQDGFRVAPFKSLNMALNSYVTPEGGEIGRAQAVQAEAAGIPPSVDMNPILLKPEAGSRSQVMLLGKPVGSVGAGGQLGELQELWPAVEEAYRRIEKDHDIIVIEGAGSPAEINLRDRDMANMRVGRMARAPVLLVGDIDRGGVFASLLGTLDLLLPADRRRIRGFVINKFRGDVSLLEPGLRFLERRAKRPVLGVVPYLRELALPEEDGVALEGAESRTGESSLLDIAVMQLPHISNFDDFDPLRLGGVALRYVRSAAELGSPDIIILPGTKATVADLGYLHESGIAAGITALAATGTPIVGICGGFQMLGERVLDPEGVESSEPDVAGLGLLPVTTAFAARKRTRQVRGRVTAGRGLLQGALGGDVSGYEIHMGLTQSPSLQAPFWLSYCEDEYADGATSEDGWVLGTYLHGLFQNDGLRQAMLENIARRAGKPVPSPVPQRSAMERFDFLADSVRSSLNMPLLYEICGVPSGPGGLDSHHDSGY